MDILLKDLRQYRRDRTLLLLGLLAPMLLAGIATLAFGQLDRPVSFTMAVADGGHPGAQAFFAAAAQTPELRNVKFETVDSAADAQQRVKSGKADTAIVLPDAAPLLEAFPIAVLRRPVGLIPVQVTQSLARNLDDRLALGRAGADQAIAAGGSPEQIQAAYTAAAVSSELSVVDLDVPARSRRTESYFAPSMTILFLFFTVGFGVRSFFAEQRDNTLARLRSCALPTRTIAVGKLGAIAVIAVGSMLVAWGSTALLAGADWGQPVAVLCLIVATVIAVIGVTALVASVARSQEQADAYASFTAFSLGLLGGNFVQPWLMPDIVRKLSLLAPNGWTLRGFNELAVPDAGLGRAFLDAAVCALFGLVAGAVALRRIDRLVPE